MKTIPYFQAYIMIRDTRHESFYFYARHENFKCKKMKNLNATRDTSIYLIIEHTDTMYPIILINILFERISYFLSEKLLDEK